MQFSEETLLLMRLPHHEIYTNGNWKTMVENYGIWVGIPLEDYGVYEFMDNQWKADYELCMWLKYRWKAGSEDSGV